MTNSQCIEVAEKVWGLSVGDIQDEYTEYLCAVEYQTNETKDEWLRDEVNSWQGFGRTLESVKEVPTMFLLKILLDDRTRDDWTTDEFIEATHLAALEAIGD